METEKQINEIETKPELDVALSEDSKSTDISQTSNKRITGNKKQNPMQEIEIEKMVLNCGGIEEKLDKSVMLLEMITGKKVIITKAKKRIPAFGISPGKGAGCKVTLRNKEEIKQLLKRFFAAIENTIKEKSITNNHLSFGIHEYIEVPGLEYKRDIGILGFEIDVVFKRKGKRTKIKKINQGKIPKRQEVSKEEIIDYLNKNWDIELTGGKNDDSE